MFDYGGIPLSSIGIDIYNSQYAPSTLHCSNNALYGYFARYLLMELFSVFKFTLPDNWALNYFRYSLFCTGHVAVVNTDKYGVIVQQSGLMGQDVYYQPVWAVIVNPMLTGILQPRIGTQCEIVKIKDDYSGILDIIQYYADHMALTAEALEMNIANSKLAVMFSARNKAGAEALKNIMDKVMSGETAVFYDEKLRTVRNGESVEPWSVFLNNLKNNFIAPDLMDELRRWKEMFCTDIGITSVRSDKKERMITAEAESTNEEKMSKVMLMRDNIKEGFDKANKMFGLNLKVELVTDGGEKRERDIDFTRYAD